MDTQSIDQLAAALALAQGEMGVALKDATNPHFKSKYADLASVLDACRPALSKHGLAVLQLPEVGDGRLVVTTVLVHKSGQQIRTSLGTKLAQDTPQAIGSAITYLRRYSLMAVVGIAPDDDDGEAAHGRGQDRRDERYEPREVRREPEPRQPEPREVRREDPHHPSWDSSKGSFFVTLSEFGDAWGQPAAVKYDTVKAWALSLGRPKPSAMDSEGRSKLLGYLNTDKGRDSLLAFARANPAASK